MNASSLAFGEQNLPPLQVCTDMTPQEKEKKSVKLLPYAVVQNGSSLRSQIHIIYATVSFLTLELQQRNLLKRFLRGPYSQLLLLPCRRETRVVADLRMTSASRAGEVGIKSSSFLLSSLGLLEGEGSVSLSALRRGFFDG